MNGGAGIVALGLGCLLVLAACGGGLSPATAGARAGTIAAPPPTPASSAPSTGETRLERLLTDHYVGPDGSLITLGLVQNPGPGDVAAIRVRVALIGEGGRLLEEATVSTHPSLLAPGATGAWQVALPGGQSFQTLAVSVRGAPAETIDYATAYSDLVVTDIARAPTVAGTTRALTGQVKNTGSVAASLVRVTAVLAGSGPGSTRLASALVASNTIEPGQSTPFTIEGLALGPDDSALPRHVLVEGVPARPCRC